jgi:Flp pilus assembly secretin CpaC
MRLHRHPLAFRILLGLLVPTALVSSSPGSGVAAEPGLVRIDVTIGKSPVIEVKDPFNRVSVTDPKIADVFVISPTQILISGKAVGVTSLVLFYPRKTLFFDLVVHRVRYPAKSSSVPPPSSPRCSARKARSSTC